jgi:hypothetical protein
MKPPTTHRLPSRRTALFTLLGSGIATLTGCASGGHFGLLGYSTEPNYDPDIRTVYVPMFKTKVFETTPYRDLEMTLTRFVVDAIESRTPMKVISDPARADSELADSELQGTVTLLRKTLMNRTPYNGAREIELALGVEIVWHDLRPGKEGRILSNPKKRNQNLPEVEGLFDPSNPPPPIAPDAPAPVFLLTAGRAIPELGESNTSALNMAMQRMAISITHAMEKTW